MPSQSLATIARYKTRAGEECTPEEAEAKRAYYAKYEPSRIDVYAPKGAKDEWRKLAQQNGVTLSAWMAIAAAEKAEGGNAVIASLQREKMKLEEELAQARQDRLELMERNLALEQTQRRMTDEVVTALAAVESAKS